MCALKVENLRCEYRTNPLGIGVRKPRISWTIDSDRRATMQKGYRIQVAGPVGDFGRPIWDTGFVASEQIVQAQMLRVLLVRF
jgi:alpha-L-rhamnosidase